MKYNFKLSPIEFYEKINEFKKQNKKNELLNKWLPFFYYESMKDIISVRPSEVYTYNEVKQLFIYAIKSDDNLFMLITHFEFMYFSALAISNIYFKSFAELIHSDFKNIEAWVMSMFDIAVSFSNTIDSECTVGSKLKNIINNWKKDSNILQSQRDKYWDIIIKDENFIKNTKIDNDFSEIRNSEREVIKIRNYLSHPNTIFTISEYNWDLLSISENNKKKFLNLLDNKLEEEFGKPDGKPNPLNPLKVKLYNLIKETLK